MSIKSRIYFYYPSWVSWNGGIPLILFFLGTCMLWNPCGNRMSFQAFCSRKFTHLSPRRPPLRTILIKRLFWALIIVHNHQGVETGCGNCKRRKSSFLRNINKNATLRSDSLPEYFQSWNTQPLKFRSSLVGWRLLFYAWAVVGQPLFLHDL